MKLVSFGTCARVGKNSAARILAKYIPVREFSFAFQLKRALKPLCLKYHKIDPFTEKDEEKLIIRPLLVAFGCSVREKNPNVWVDALHHDIKVCEAMGMKETFVITDLRFLNELEWVKEMNGLVINIDRIMDNGQILQPANETEAENYIKIKPKADICLTAKNLTELEDEIVKKVLPML